MHFTTAVFDMDGTLFDTERIALDCWQKAFSQYGVHVLRNELETVIGLDGKGTKAFLSNFKPAGTDFAELMERARAIRKAYVERHGLPIKAGATELLALLHGRGVKLGLATTTHAERTLENLTAAHFTDYFQVIVCGDHVERHKPYPDSYLKVLAELQVAPADAIALEDSDHGIQAAHAAGMRVIHIPDIKRIDETARACVYREYASLLDFRNDLPPHN